MGGESKYATDFYRWATEQSALLRAGRLSEADLDNIAAEIESLGPSEKRELVNRLAALLAHLLKWQFQSGLRSTRWRLTIVEQRDRLAEHLKDSPTLKPHLPEALRTAYRFSRLTAQRETGLPDSVFPATCPYSFEQTENEQFWPD